MATCASRPPSWRVSLAISGISAAVTGVFIINFCDLVYGCGCRSWWAGAVDYCNIHATGVRHCPWCSIGNAGFAGVAAFILIPQAALSFRRGWSFVRRLTASLLAFPVLGLIAAVALGLLHGYW